MLGGAISERETFEAVVFVSGLSDFPTRAQGCRPTALAAWVNGLHLTVTEALRHFDGVPVKYMGDGFLGFFTGPRMRSRAVQAALRARDLVDHAGLHVALNAGEIYLGTIGHPEYATPDILGATVNTAFIMLPRVPALCASGVAVSASMTTAELDGVEFVAREDLFEPEDRRSGGPTA